MKECTIYLLRHGQSLGNQDRIYLGHTNLDLSEVGYEQAKITAEHLKGVKFDAVYSSDLLRAHNTALPHALLRGLCVQDSVNLREIFLGEWENKKIDDLVNNHYESFVVGWKENFGTFTVPGGESVLGAGKRFYNEVLKIAEKNEGKTILIAAHAAVIRVFWCLINEIKPELMAVEIPFPTNSSYSILTFDGEKFTPVEYSCDLHLREKGNGIKEA